ncbi:hypothetical protein J6590_018833 [Homalodisca vitripennis]|nr:hypothetical protein J6590_018833 [Homalodisca vitripennis]
MTSAILSVIQVNSRIANPWNYVGNVIHSFETESVSTLAGGNTSRVPSPSHPSFHYIGMLSSYYGCV